MCSQLLELTELPPGVDQRVVLAAEQNARIAAGWQADQIGPYCSFFFAQRSGERIIVGIERDPGPQMCR